MQQIWRFRLVRFDHTSYFIRRSIGPVVGGIGVALDFANQVQVYFGDEARRVEAWTDGFTLDPAGRLVFHIVRHENKRDWRLLENRLTHPLWCHKLNHALDYAAFRGRGHSLQI